MGKRKRKSASNVDAAPAAVTLPSKSAKKRAKKRAKKALQKEVAGSQKQETVNGNVELAVEGNTFQTEIQKEQTNFSEVRVAEEEQNKALKLNNATEKGACPPTLSKTVCLSNLSDSIEEDDVKNFFKFIGEVAEVRFAMRDDQFAGFVQVDFTTAEAAQEALKLDNSLLLDLPVKIDLLEEQGVYTSGNSACSEEKPYQEGGQGTYIEKPQATGSKTLFMGNLSCSIKKDDVKNFFKDVGEIADIRFCYKEGRVARYGHVEFTTPEAALEALKLNNTELVGRPVRLELAIERDRPVKLDLARERSAQHPTTPRTIESKTKTLYLGNLSSKIKEHDIKDFFKDVGEVAKVLYTKGPGGYGWVKFTTGQAAQEALKLNKKLIRGRHVKLDLARESVDHPTTRRTTEAKTKTFYLGNLSYAVKEDDVKDFFKDVGEVAGVLLATDDGPVGFGWVRFTTTQAAKEVLKLNNKLLLDRPVKLDLAREQGTSTTENSNKKSYPKGGQVQQTTVYIVGFNPSDKISNIRSKLEEHFGECGKISRLFTPTKDIKTGVPKGFAIIKFEDGNGFKKALKLNGSQVEGYKILVKEAKLRSGGHGEGDGDGGKGRSIPNFL